VSKRTLFLIFALFIITSVLLMLALYKPSNPKLPQTKIVTSPEPIAQTTLLFGEPAVANISSTSANLTYSLPINITTGKNKVTAVQLELQYDPKVLANVSATPGPFFKNPVVLLNQTDIKTGRISYAFGIGLQDQPSVGYGVVATLSFTALSGIPQSTAIIFLPKTLVTAEGINKSVLKLTNSATFNVGIVPSTTPSAISKP